MSNNIYNKSTIIYNTLIQQIVNLFSSYEIISRANFTKCLQGQGLFINLEKVNFTQCCRVPESMLVHGVLRADVKTLKKT